MQTMLPAGYLFKTIGPAPDWLGPAGNVKAVCSISACISANFADYISQWRHNGCWLFDDPAIMLDIAQREGIDMSPMTLFYYEVFCREYNEISKDWESFDRSIAPVNVIEPAEKLLLGFDVNCCSQKNSPECSPLSCNRLCSEISVNEHCLFNTFDEARTALLNGVFDNSEPGPFRIYTVYRIGAAKPAGALPRSVREPTPEP